MSRSATKNSKKRSNRTDRDLFIKELTKYQNREIQCVKEIFDQNPGLVNIANRTRQIRKETGLDPLTGEELKPREMTSISEPDMGRRTLCKLDGISAPGTGVPSGEGIKNDHEKTVRPELIPVRALQDWSKILAFGAKKYSDRNWEKGILWSRVYGALQRHLLDWFGGQDLDEESGENHLAHAICNLGFLLEFTRTHPELDDRIKS